MCERAIAERLRGEGQEVKWEFLRGAVEFSSGGFRRSTPCADGCCFGTRRCWCVPPAALGRDFGPEIVFRWSGGGAGMLAQRHVGGAQHEVVRLPRQSFGYRAAHFLRNVEQNVRHGARVVQRMHGWRREADDALRGSGFGDDVNPGFEWSMVGK